MMRSPSDPMAFNRVPPSSTGLAARHPVKTSGAPMGTIDLKELSGDQVCMDCGPGRQFSMFPQHGSPRFGWGSLDRKRSPVEADATRNPTLNAAVPSLLWAVLWTAWLESRKSLIIAI
jgi:hypothetical protein